MRPFDERLFQLKFQPINQRMHVEAGKCWARAHAEMKQLGNHAHLLPAFVENHLAVLRTHLEDIYRLRREVWLMDGNPLTPDFIRTIVVTNAFAVIAARKGAIQHELNRRVSGPSERQRGWHILAHEMNRLQTEIANRYEVDAIEIGKQAARNKPAANTDFVALRLESQSAEGKKAAVPNLSNYRAEVWSELRETYQALAQEEQGRTVAITDGKILRTMDQLTRASYDYSEHPEGWERGKPEQGLICLLETPPYGVWITSDGISENFRERVGLSAVKSGLALGCPAGTDPEDYWLHNLHVDLLQNKSDLLYAVSERGGMILSVCVASATFCSRLESKALKQAEPDARTVKTPHPVDRIVALKDVLMPDERLQELGLVDFSGHRLEKIPDKRLLELSDQAEGQYKQLRSAVRPGQTDFDLERAEVMSKQIRKELARRGKLPPDSQSRHNAARSRNNSTPIGRNIDRLRKECGWSFDELADRVGIDKKSVLSHVNYGRRPNPRNLKYYSQAFTKAMQKAVSVADLEKEPQ